MVGLPTTASLGGPDDELQHWLCNYYPVYLDSALFAIGVIVVDVTEIEIAKEASRKLTRSSAGALAAAGEARDLYTAGHQSRVELITETLATTLGIAAFDVEGIGLAASIHDIGKIAIPAEILCLPRRLTTTEFELVRTHSRVRHDIVNGIAFPWPVATMIVQHHERIDGSGYPDALVDDDILMGSRILAVADVAEAMSSHRPYRPCLEVELVLGRFTAGRGSLYDSNVVDALMELHHSGTIALGSQPFPARRRDDIRPVRAIPDCDNLAG